MFNGNFPKNWQNRWSDWIKFSNTRRMRRNFSMNFSAFPRRFGPVRGIPISDRTSLPIYSCTQVLNILWITLKNAHCGQSWTLFELDFHISCTGVLFRVTGHTEILLNWPAHDNCKSLKVENRNPGWKHGFWQNYTNS